MHFINDITLHLNHRALNVTVLMERKSAQSMSTFSLDPTIGTHWEPIKLSGGKLQALVLPTTPQLRGLFHTRLNTLRTLSPLKTHIFSKFRPNLNVICKQGDKNVVQLTEH